MENNLCKECHKRPILIKKRGLCSVCYQKLRKEKGPFLIPLGMYRTNASSYNTVRLSQQYSEIEFLKNYQTDVKQMIYQPAMFHLNGVSYTPDFYDTKRNVFIEVSGSRQAYHSNKDKYKKFREYFTGLVLEVRKPDGNILDESRSRLSWK